MRDRRWLLTAFAFLFPALLVLVGYGVWYAIDTLRLPMWNLWAGWVVFMGAIGTQAIWRKS